MKAIKYITYIVAFALVSILNGCSDDNDFDFSKDYDIPWKISKITDVSPLSASTGATITIQGENLGADLVPSTGVIIGTEICTIVSQTATSITVLVPSFSSTDAVEVAVQNLHNRKFVFDKKFTPVLNARD